MNPYYEIIAGRFICKGLFLSDRLKLLDKFELRLNTHILWSNLTFAFAFSIKKHFSGEVCPSKMF